MHNFMFAASITLVVLSAGCNSGSTTTPPVTTSPAVVQSEPKYKAVIAISTKPNGLGIVNCTSDMAAVGGAACGPESSLAELSWEFIEHRDGSDFYEVNYKLSNGGDSIFNKIFTVEFDGTQEKTVIDAEQYIVIRRGPLNAEPTVDIHE
jgi:hypothetical protein